MGWLKLEGRTTGQSGKTVLHIRAGAVMYVEEGQHARIHLRTAAGTGSQRHEELVACTSGHDVARALAAHVGMVEVERRGGRNAGKAWIATSAIAWTEEGKEGCTVHLEGLAGTGAFRHEALRVEEGATELQRRIEHAERNAQNREGE